MTRNYLFVPKGNDDMEHDPPRNPDARDGMNAMKQKSRIKYINILDDLVSEDGIARIKSQG